MTLNKAKGRRAGKNKRIKMPPRNKGSKDGRLYRTTVFDLFFREGCKK